MTSRAIRGRDGQRGVSMPQIIVAIAVGGFVLLTGFKLLPIYLESYSISNALSSVRRAAAEEPGPVPPQRLKRMVMRRFSVNDVDGVREALEVYNEGNETIVRVAYERRTPWLANIDLVVSFDKQVEVPRR